MEFVKLIPINRICPCCGNGNYMRIISGKYVGELNVKCINCNSYYNYDELLKRDNSKPLNGADGRKIDDLISRAAAIDAIVSVTAFPDVDYIKNLCQNPANSEDWLGGVCDAINAVEDVNAVNAAPVVHGYWRDEAGNPVCWDEAIEGCTRGSCWCSMCGDWLVASDEYPVRGNYCPNCGARMDGEANDQR